ncbi:MAG: sugar phosphate isomerase/epimerase [Oscillospiraceae bacterium]|nr:sugar phosphate isomerase/epimerase [Oscillospiraceae bacterium]
MRLGGPIFKPTNSIEEIITEHRRIGFGAAYCTQYISDNSERDEYKAAFKEADILIAEYPAYCINILDTDPAIKNKNKDEICDRLSKADEMGAICCVMHGGSIETGGWGSACKENLSERSFFETVVTIQSIIDRVKPKTTKLVMETESYLLPDSPEVYARLINAVDRTEFAVHLDPVNIISSPRRYYFNGDFIKRCFAILGDYIVSCHAKDFNMAPIYPTVKIDETFIGDGILDYSVYLNEILKMRKQPTLMIEHLNEAQLVRGVNYIFKQAAEMGLTFEGSQHREQLSEDGASTEYFAPHLT